jgi:hypothetical protein
MTKVEPSFLREITLSRVERESDFHWNLYCRDGLALSEAKVVFLFAPMMTLSYIREAVALAAEGN